MNEPFDHSDHDLQFDHLTGKTKEEEACGRVLLAIGGVGLTILTLYSISAVCRIMVRAV